MKVHELRVDNWVKSAIDGQPVKVDWLVIKHMWDGNIQSVYDPKPVYEPIPLTEEVLRKAGFENHHYFVPSCLILIGYVYIYYSIPDQVLYYEDAGLIEIEIKSLHHLQNSIWILTGQELEVKW